MSEHGIIFLDIDGVLVNRKSIARGFKVMDDECVRVLDDMVVRRKEARIVISSTWRLSESLKSIRAMLQRHGFKFGDRIIDVTTDSAEFDGVLYRSRPRELEIKDWLDNHPAPSWFVVIDDEPVPLFEARQIKTRFEHGLRRHHLEQFLDLVLIAEPIAAALHEGESK